MTAIALSWPPAPDALAAIPRNAVHDMIDALIARLDEMDPDPDVEPNGDELDGTNAEDEHHAAGEFSTWCFWDGPGCKISDPDGPSTPEWHTLGRHKARTHAHPMPDEDVELDDEDTGVEDGPRGFDPEEDMCSAGDDRVSSGTVIRAGHNDDHGPGDAEDAECEQMLHDVPCLPVFAIEPSIFNGQRTLLGLSNLQPSFKHGASRQVEA